MTVTETTNSQAPAAPHLGRVVYRFEGQLGELNPIGLFDEGIRYHNSFEGTIVDGTFAGGRIYGLDKFLLRPDGVGEIHAPEVVELGEHRVELDVHGYVVPPAGAPAPPLRAVLQPGFEFPDVPLRITGSALAATASPEYSELNSVTIVIEGSVNMATGRLEVTSRIVERPDS